MTNSVGESTAATDLINSLEVANLLGLTHRNTVMTYQRRYPDMPHPVIDEGARRPKLWSRAEIEAWAASRAPRTSEHEIRDAFYSAILEGLDGPLDPRLFELCVVDLLADEFPVVPVEGGDDGGMDGAVADGDGPAYPVVTTTGENAIGNLDRNLRRYVDSGGERRRAIFATSRPLTPRRRRNLEERAASMGFELVQILDGRAMADRLYRNPRWCRELLGLTGSPPALSGVPPSSRRARSFPLVGRESELDVLRSSDSDVLVVGQPGSGKTALFVELVREGLALFVVDFNREAIANGLRQEKPPIVVIDDADSRIEEVRSLIHLREELDADFRIIVSCWPGARDRVARGLGIGAVQLDVPRLTRDQIVQVVAGAGIAGPTELVRELVDQAEGLPGLAAMLANVVLRSGITSLVNGDAVRVEIVGAIEPVVGRVGSQILKVVSLSGEAGLTVGDTAEVLGVSTAEAQGAMEALDFSGVLFSTANERLVTKPDALRRAIVREMFSPRGAPFPIDHVLARATPESIARELAAASASGASVDWRVLQRVLERAGSAGAWAQWAAASVREARYVSKHYPWVVIQQPEPFLYWIPDAALDALLANNADLPPGYDGTGVAIDAVRTWVANGPSSGIGAVERRRALVSATDRCIQQGCTSQLAADLLKAAINPGFEEVEQDPGSGNTITITSGFLPPSDIAQLVQLWSEAVVPLLRSLEPTAVPTLLSGVASWLPPYYPEPIGDFTRHEVVLEAGARQMLSDIQEVWGGHPGVVRAVRDLGDMSGGDSEFELYDMLFAGGERRDIRTYEDARLQDLRQLATEWRSRQIVESVRDLAIAEEMAADMEHRWPRFTPRFCEMLADDTDQPAVWVREMAAAALDPDLVFPFVIRAIAECPDTAWEAMRELLESSRYRWLVVSVALTETHVPRDVRLRALELAREFPSVLMWEARRERLDPSAEIALLEHESQELAGSVAVGIWLRAEAQPDGELLSPWRRAVVMAPIGSLESTHWLGEILARDRALAANWVETMIVRDPVGLAGFSDLHSVVSTLSDAVRSELLEDLQPDYVSSRVAIALVGNRPAVYRKLLKDGRLQVLHLAPLEGQPSTDWLTLAREALSLYPPDEVARASFSGIHIWSGSEADMWAAWLGVFESLDDSGDRQIAEVRARGAEIAGERMERARQREHNEAIHGRG